MNLVRECVDPGHWLIPRCRPDKCRHWTTVVLERYDPEGAADLKMIMKLCEGTEQGLLRAAASRLLPTWQHTDADELLEVARSVLE